MAAFKLLVDTNVVIALEDPQPVQASLAELIRLCNEHSIGIFVDGANFDDVARDRNDQRRKITLSKLEKFQRLRNIPLPDEPALVARFGAIKNDNDRSDVRLLATLESKAVDFLVTADIGLHKRAEKASLDTGVQPSRSADVVKAIIRHEVSSVAARRGKKGLRTFADRCDVRELALRLSDVRSMVR